MPSASPPLVGVILAGGSSTRMGQDKVLMPIAGKPMLAHAVERFAPQVRADGAERERRTCAVFFVQPAGRQ